MSWKQLHLACKDLGTCPDHKDSGKFFFAVLEKVTKHSNRGKQVDAAVILGEWEMALRELDGLVQEMEDRTAAAGYMVGEVSLAMQVLRVAIRKILQENKISMECMKDKDKEMEKLRAEVMKMRKEEARKLQAQKEKYDDLLLEARQEGRSEEELEPFYEVGARVFTSSRFFL